VETALLALGLSYDRVFISFRAGRRFSGRRSVQSNGAQAKSAGRYPSRVVGAQVCSGSSVIKAEDNRRVSNGDQVSRVAALAMKRGKSVDFTGYWQRHVAGS
jgi:hypothetical protein